MVTVENNRLALATEDQLIQASKAIYDELSIKLAKQHKDLGQEFAVRVEQIVTEIVQRMLPQILDEALGKLTGMLQSMPTVNVMIPPRNVEKTIEYDGMNRPYKVSERELV